MTRLLIVLFVSIVPFQAFSTSYSCRAANGDRSAEVTLTEGSFPDFKLAASFPTLNGYVHQVDGKGKLQESFDYSTGETEMIYAIRSGEDRMQLKKLINAEGQIRFVLGALIPQLSPYLFAISCNQR